MNAFGLAGLLIALSSLGLGLLVLLRSSDRTLARIWFLFSWAVGFWGMGMVWISYTKQPETGHLAWMVTYGLGVIWIAPFFYHFVCVFLGQFKWRVIIFNYLVGVFFLCFLPTSFFFRRTDFLFNQFCYIRAGPIYNFFIAWWFGVVILAHYDLIQALKLSSPEKRNQIQYFFLATAIGYTGGTHSYFPKIGIDVYPWGIFGVALYPVIMTYAVLRYNLMDIRIFIRRAALLIGVYAGLIVLGGFSVYFLHHQITVYYGSAFLSGIEIFLLATILSLGPFLYAHLIRRNTFFHEHTLAGITHEMKSPLAMIESAVEILSTKIHSGGNKADQVAYVEMIERNATRLSGFVNDLLQVYRVQDKKAALNMKELDVVALCKKVIDGKMELAIQKNLQLALVGSPPPTIISVDENKIEQVVSNLLSNAIKFTEKGRINIEVIPTANHVTVKISDTGIGISSNDLPYIFDRFFQGGINKSVKGTGIGLAIAKAWVEAHGGRIWAESDGEGKGTAVKFTLPI